MSKACEPEECADCLADVDSGLGVPAVSDDEAWEDLATQHRDDCEWIATRAHRREAPVTTVGA